MCVSVAASGDGTVGTTVTETTFTYVPPAVEPLTIVGLCRLFVRGRCDGDGDDNREHLLQSRETVAGYLTKPTVMGSLITLVARSSWILGDRVVQELEFLVLFFRFRDLIKGSQARVSRPQDSSQNRGI